MFTVIICDKKIIDDCKTKYNAFLSSFFSEEIVYLSWNTEGTNIDKAVPELRETIADKKDWRVLILNTYGIAKVPLTECVNDNPFDLYSMHDYDPSGKKLKKLDDLKTIDDVINYNRNVKQVFREVSNEPLVRLTNWLMRPYVNFFSIEEELSDNEIREKLKDEENDSDRLIVSANKFRTQSSSQITQKIIAQNNDCLFENLPKNVTVLSERAVYCDEIGIRHSEIHKDEYLNFVENNLFPHNVRFLVFDVEYNHEKIRISKNNLPFCTLINILATNEYPNDAIKPYKVYKVDIKLKEDVLLQKCDDFVSDLLAAKASIESLEKQEMNKKATHLNRKDFETLFERDETIVCEIDKEYGDDGLYCEHDRIGLSQDCPESEEEYWDGQSDSIHKEFIKYMRQPQRAVKTKVKDNFHIKKDYYDERIADLTEYQCEDVEYKLISVEEQLSEIDPQDILDIDDYSKRIDEADDKIRARIDQRMNKKPTIIFSLILIILFTIGACAYPLNAYIDGEDIWSYLSLALAAIIIFTVVLFVTLLVFKYLLVRLFKKFNKTISGIISDIFDSLVLASHYLSENASIMRLNGIINYFGKKSTNLLFILNKHKKDLDEVLSETYSEYDHYLSPLDKIKVKDDKNPFGYDYTKKIKYHYDMKMIMGTSTISYLQEDNLVEIPSEFVDEVTLQMEEMYGQYY